eukprot:388375-Rhodomonas_salina.1
MARAKLEAAAEEAEATAKEEEEERKRLEEEAEGARKRVAAYEAKQEAVKEYNLQHDGRVNVQVSHHPLLPAKSHSCAKSHCCVKRHMLL